MTAQPYYTRDGVTLHLGDSLHILPTLPDASIDAIVTDPPYGLSDLPPAAITQAITAWTTGDRTHVPNGKGGFMGQDWDRFVPPPGLWDECFRVLKPGGHLAAFAGARTVDLMGLSIRLAGFEIRDSIHWITGGGVPKSLDVSKAIDKQRDDRSDVLRVTAFIAAARDAAGLSNRDLDEAFGFNGMAGHWTTRGAQPLVPTWEQWGRLRELLSFGSEMDAEVWRLNARKGTPGEAWDQREVLSQRTVEVKGGSWAQLVSSGRYAVGQKIISETAPATEDAKRWQGWGTSIKPAHEPIVLARKPLVGTVAGTVLTHGTGALNIDGCRIALERDTRNQHASEVGTDSGSAEQTGRWPTNVLLGHGPECVDGGTCQAGCPVPQLGEVARVFPVFRYEAKAPASERPCLADGITHPTVKPVALMSWLVRLVTPPGGTVLEPFAGSGATLEACVREGFEVIGIEQHKPYAELCRVRLEKPVEVVLFSDVA